MPIKVVSIMEANSVTGPAKNLLEFATRSRKEVEVSVIAYRRGEEPESAFIQAARKAGVPVDVVFEKGRFDASVVQRLKEIVRQRSPDIVQTHNVKSHFLLRFSGIWKTLPWVAFHHGYTAENLNMQVYNQANRWSLRAARQVVTVCEPFADQLVAQGVLRKRIQVRHNSVAKFRPPDPTAVAAARAKIPAEEGTRLLLSVGRLSSEKGHADLLHATTGLQAHLVIIGDGVDRAPLEKLRAELGLESKVTFLGFQPDVRPYYSLADVVVLPSHSEGSPNVLLEAMAAGRAIVATQVGGVPEIARDEETALLVKPHSPPDLARAIARLLADPDLSRRLGEKSHHLAETEFSPEAYQRSLVMLYQRVLFRTPELMELIG